ncbi:MAG TPA: hypothetical protein VK724_27510 [Bryobacteraceae bacterium]|jgi:hypothetical protein|nr:hypothetical protein [Bryobacteraceae bacterium]
MFGKFGAALSIGFFLWAGATAARADVVLFQDIGGTGAVTTPAEYPIQGCGLTQCEAEEPYPYTFTANTIPDITYIGDGSGDVSDEIVASVTPYSLNPTEVTVVDFTFYFGLDLVTPETCASVGGCAITRNGSIQGLGTITYGPGFFTPPDGFTTTLEYQYVPTPEPSQLLVVGALFSMMLMVIARRNGKSRVTGSDPS